MHLYTPQTLSDASMDKRDSTWDIYIYYIYIFIYGHIYIPIASFDNIYSYIYMGIYMHIYLCATYIFPGNVSFIQLCFLLSPGDISHIHGDTVA